LSVCLIQKIKLNNQRKFRTLGKLKTQDLRFNITSVDSYKSVANLTPVTSYACKLSFEIWFRLPWLNDSGTV